jgi:hypothetical protein
MKTKRINKGATVGAICVSLMLLTCGAVTGFAANATLAENEAIWGKALGIQKLENGMEKRFYKCQNTMDLGYYYFVYKDSMVIEEGLAVTVPETKKIEEQGIPATEWSKGYYQNHIATVADEDKSWGKPVAVRALKDGLEERYYKTGNAMDMGNPFFQVKDGKVVASGVAGKDRVAVIASQDKKTGQKGLPVIEWNTDYYQHNATTTVDLDKVWGKPVAVKVLKDGSEERYYKFGNTMGPDNPFFLVKDGKVIASGIAGAADIKS